MINANVIYNRFGRGEYKSMTAEQIAAALNERKGMRKLTRFEANAQLEAIAAEASSDDELIVHTALYYAIYSLPGGGALIAADIDAALADGDPDLVGELYKGLITMTVSGTKFDAIVDEFINRNALRFVDTLNLDNENGERWQPPETIDATDVTSAMTSAGFAANPSAADGDAKWTRPTTPKPPIDPTQPTIPPLPNGGSR